MSQLSDEVQMLARLEIETVLENSQLGDFAMYIDELFKFPMSEMITDYFIEGAAFGTVTNDDRTEMDKDLFCLPLHEDMRNALKVSNFQGINEKDAVTLFERLFLQGAQWAIIHKQINEDDSYFE